MDTLHCGPIFSDRPVEVEISAEAKSCRRKGSMAVEWSGIEPH
jgi:hypothetical protein